MRHCMTLGCFPENLIIFIKFDKVYRNLYTFIIGARTVIRWEHTEHQSYEFFIRFQDNKIFLRLYGSHFESVYILLLHRNRMQSRKIKRISFLFVTSW